MQWNKGMHYRGIFFYDVVWLFTTNVPCFVNSNIVSDIRVSTAQEYILMKSRIFLQSCKLTMEDITQ